MNKQEARKVLANELGYDKYVDTDGIDAYLIDKDNNPVSMFYLIGATGRMFDMLVENKIK